MEKRRLVEEVIETSQTFLQDLQLSDLNDPKADRHEGSPSQRGLDGEHPAAGEDRTLPLKRRVHRNVHLLKRKWLELQSSLNSFADSHTSFFQVTLFDSLNFVILPIYFYLDVQRGFIYFLFC